MQLIDPYQFRDLCGSARSLAIVGNAPCILDWKNGARIEAADLVVRFNRARTAGMEEAIAAEVLRGLGLLDPCVLDRRKRDLRGALGGTDRGLAE